MKKWKALLVMLCAMLVSIGLFACNKGDSESDIANITRATGTSNLSYTDNDKWENIVSDLEKKVTLTCRPVKGDNFTVEGKDCSYTSTISFNGDGHCEIGFYTVTITPKENNPKNVSREVDVQITHDFATQGDREVCNYCAATRTFAAEDAIIHYGGFHKHGSTFNGVPQAVYGEDGSNGKAFYNKNAEAGTATYIEQFGKVKRVKGVEYTMPTLTVGRLEPGMTITVKGTAQSRYGEAWSSVDDGDAAEDKGYFFPVIGFADRSLNNPAWDGGEARTDYTGGGTSVIVRGEGWVLYNGIDSSHADGSVVRMLSGLGTTNSGSGTGRNYGSHELASHETTEKVPDSFTQGQIPAVENWNDWVVYSTGTTSASGVYGENTQIELTWNYRQDGVIELSYNVNGSKLLCLIKVPASSTGYYDTILHGDYVDMHITSYERIETRTPKEFNISVSKDNYYEGQTFNPSTVSASFKYEQTGDESFPQALELANFYATTALEVNESTQWVSLADNKMSASFNHYKVEILKGGVTWTKTFAKDQLNIVPNNIVSAAGATVGAFENNNALGAFTLSTDGTNMILTPADGVYAQTIPAGQNFTGTVSDAHRYAAVKLAGTFGDLTSVKYEDGTEVPYIYDKENGTIVFALSKAGKVVVEGLQTTKTVFDFGQAKGFDISATIEKDTANDGWKLNNPSNTVTVTFKAAEGKELGRVFIDNGRLNLSQLTDMTADYVRDGYTILADGTSYQNGLLTVKIAFGAANLANYAARTIEVEVNGNTEFAYKLEYIPDFAANDTIDAGYYSFVSDNKLYIAKAAETEENLTLNLNEGNENVALLDLSYTYADGAVTFKNGAELNGVVASVLEINGGQIVLVEIDPSAYEISATKFGYQFMTENYSEFFYAVEDNAAARQSVSGGSVTVINNGSCLEQGLAGKIVSAGDVKFVANVETFGGSHEFTRIAAGQKCQLCGETVSRDGIGQSVTLHDNEFVEVTETYKSGFANVYNGVTLKLTAGGDWYWLRNDGFIGDNGYTDAAIGEDIWSSLGDDARTPNGKLDGDGNEIDEDSFKATMKAGAAFRIWAGYQDGTVTVIWRLYKKDDATLLNGYGKVYYEFTHKFMNLTEDAVTLQFATDGCTLGNNGSTGTSWWFKAGKLDKNMIESVAGTGVTLAHANIENHFATVTATGGNAQATTESGYAKEIAFTINLKENYTTGNANAVVYSDAEFKNPVEGATASVSGKAIEVKVLLKENETPGVYYIDLKDDKGSTKQCDIKVDLTAVSMYGTTASVNTDNAFILKDSTVTVEYTDLPADMTGAKFVVNGAEQAIAANMTFGNVTATWANNTLTLSIPAQMTLTGIPAFDVVLMDAEGKAIVTSKFSLTDLPASLTNGAVVESNSVYAYAYGDKLNIYLFGEKATGTDYLVFNANNAATDKDKILPYNLAYSMAGAEVSFKEASGLTANALTATHFEQGNFKVTQFVIDLGYFKIGADAAYVLELVTDKANYGTEYYTVSGGEFNEASVGGVPAQVPVVENGCTAIGSNGCEVKDGPETLGYFNIKVVPSHTWGTNATDATLFECTVCGAVLKNGASKGTLIPAAHFGDNKFNAENGISISYFQKSANSDWDSLVARTKYGTVNICSPNLQTNVMTTVTGEAETLKTKLKNENVFPSTAGAILEEGYAWDTIKNTANCYITVTVKQGVGIVYYLNGNKMLTYPATMQFGASEGTVDDFIRLFMLCAAEEGLYVTTTQFAGAIDTENTLIQKGALTDEGAAVRYQLYMREKNKLNELVPHVHAYTEAGHKCACGALDPLYDYPVYNMENTFDVGVATANEAKTLVWVNYIQKGEKFVFTGTHKSNSNDNWAGINVSLGSYKTVDSVTMRVDRWVDGSVSDQNDNGGKHVAENWTFTKSNSSFNDWGGVHATARKDGNVTITVDWQTDETKLSINIELNKDSTTTAFEYVFSATEGNLRDRYNFAFGCGLSYSDLKVTQAPTRADAPTAVTE